MDQSPQPVEVLEVNLKLPSGKWMSYQARASEGWEIFYRESETDHTNDTTAKHLPQGWVNVVELICTKRVTPSERAERLGRPGGGVHDRAPDPREGFRKEETQEGFGDSVHQAADG